MSNVVQILEALGRNPKLVAKDEFEVILADACSPVHVASATLVSDVEALKEKLTAASTMYCLVFPAEDEPQEGEVPEDDDQAPEQETVSQAA